VSEDEFRIRANAAEMVLSEERAEIWFYDSDKGSRLVNSSNFLGQFVGKPKGGGHFKGISLTAWID